MFWLKTISDDGISKQGIDKDEKAVVALKKYFSGLIQALAKNR